MLVTVNKIKHMALHGSQPSQITSSKILVMQTLFRVSNEIGLILFSCFLGNNSLKELLAVSWSKKASGKEKSRKKKNRTTIAKLFALHINSTRIVIITFLKFLKLTGKLLVMPSDITRFWSKEKYAKKIVQLKPILVFESKYLLKVTCPRV